MVSLISSLTGSSDSEHDENMVCNLTYEVDKLIKLSFIQLVISNVVKIILFLIKGPKWK